MFKKNPMNDEHYEGNDPQIEDLKQMVCRLRDEMQEALDTLTDLSIDLEGGDEEALAGVRLNLDTAIKSVVEA